MQISRICCSITTQVSLIIYAMYLCLGSRNLIGEEGFRNALYMVDIGQNDLADSFSKNMSYIQVVKRIPSIILEIKSAVEVSLETNSFLVHFSLLHMLILISCDMYAF